MEIKVEGKTEGMKTLQEVLDTVAGGQLKGETEFVIMGRNGCILHNTNPINIMAMTCATWEEVLGITDDEAEVENLSELMHSAIDIAKRHRLEKLNGKSEKDIFKGAMHKLIDDLLG